MDEFDYELFLFRLRQLRLDAKLSQVNVAKGIGINYLSYNNYEKRNCFPPLKVIFALCRFYGVSSDYLLGLSDSLDNSFNCTDSLNEKSSEMRLIKKVEVLYYG